MKITNFIVLIIVLILLLAGTYYYWKNQKKTPSPPAPVPPSPVPAPPPVPTPPTPSPPVPPILCNNQFKPKKNPPGCVLCASPVEAWDSISKKCIKWENT